MAELYESEITKFMREFLENNPQIPEKQRQNRATWWDRPVDLEEVKRHKESQVPVKGYYYYPLPGAADSIED
ncbi:MAG: DUF3460 family protein [Betaproteobacteria bacterium]|nr:DUF3460 family protein [Betaproteobacteria bacterium]